MLDLIGPSHRLYPANRKLPTKFDPVQVNDEKPDSKACKIGIGVNIARIGVTVSKPTLYRKRLKDHLLQTSDVTTLVNVKTKYIATAR